MGKFTIKQRRIIKLQMLAILLLLLLGSSQFADGQETYKNRVTITEPIENRPISASSLHVRGECDIRDGNNIWVLYHWRGPGGSPWQVHKATICENGHWEGGIIHLPNQTGSIDIVATTFDGQKEKEKIQRLLEGKYGDQLPTLMGETRDSRATVTVDIVR